MSDIGAGDLTVVNIRRADAGRGESPANWTKRAAIALLARGECDPVDLVDLAGVSRQRIDQWISAAAIDWRGAKQDRLRRLWMDATGTVPVARRRTDGRASNPRALAAAATRIAAAFTGGDTRRIWGMRTNARLPGLTRMVAIYLMAAGLGMDRRQVGEIIGRHPKTIDHALATIEARRDDPDFDAAMTRLELELRLSVAAEDIAG